MGWFGFNGGSQLAMGTADDAIAVSTIFMNTFLAGAGGVIVVYGTKLLFSLKIDDVVEQYPLTYLLVFGVHWLCRLQIQILHLELNY